MMTYDEVFELSRKKIKSTEVEPGYDMRNSSYQALCLIQKWLRDERNIHVFILLEAINECTALVITEHTRLYAPDTGGLQLDYETALLRGVWEGLKLLP